MKRVLTFSSDTRSAAWSSVRDDISSTSFSILTSWTDGGGAEEDAVEVLASVLANLLHL